MADLNYSVGVNVKNAQSSLETLNKKVKTSTNAFSGLKKAIAGLAIASFVKSSFEMANAMTDLSAATNISVKSIIGFGQAMAANGGSVEKSSKALNELVRRIGDAKDGTAASIDAFDKVGISLEQLYKLSEQDVLKKVVEGLGKMDSPSKRAAASMQLFSLAVKGVDFRGLNNQIGAFTHNASSYAAAVTSAGQVNQDLKNVLEQLKIKLLRTIKPLVDVAKWLLEGKSAIAEFSRSTAGLVLKWTAFIAIAVAVGRILIAVGRAIMLIINAFKSLWQAVVGMIAVWKRFSGVVSGNVTFIVEFNSKLSKLWAVFSQYFKANWPELGKAIAYVFGAAVATVTVFYDKVKSVWKSLHDFLDDWGMLPEPDDQAGKKIKINLEQRKQLHQDINDKQQQLNQFIADENKALNAANKKYKERSAATLEALQHQKDMIGLTADQVTEIETVRQFTKDYENELGALKSKLEELNKAPAKHKEEIALIQKHVTELTSAYNEQLPAVKKLAAEITAKRKEVEKELAAQEEIKRLAEETAQAIKDSKDFTYSLAESTAEAQRAFDSMDMNPLEKNINKISRDIKAKLATEIKKLNDIKTDKNAKEINKQVAALTKAADEAIKKQQELAAKSYEHQRTFSYGWKKAFQQYKDDATNSAKTAERIFNKTTSGIEDMIVNLAKTGKFEWKDFAASILEEMLRTQIKILAADVFGDATKTGSDTAAHVLRNTPVGGGQQQQSNGGGLLGGIGSLVSGIGGLFGGGSQAQGRTPTIAPQQRQPQPASGGMWDTVKSVGSALGGAVGGIAKGIGSLFSGFFADGGAIPSGKFGIVGERGPEMISGPANITPMSSGGSSNVTYNIQAVDAQSFQALVARDPSFIHAVAMQGAKGTPSRR